MKPVIKYILIGLLVAAVAAISVVGVAYAQGENPPRLLENLAELLGLTQQDLREELQSGKTIQELADDAGFDLKAYQAEMVQARHENMKSRIEEALTNGAITQEQADWLLEGLEKGFLDGPFWRFGKIGTGEFSGRAPRLAEGMPDTPGGKPDPVH